MDSKLLAFIAIAITLMATMQNGATSHHEFEAFKTKFNKAYDSDAENTYRLAVYLMRVEEMIAHNADETQTYKMGINQFSDITNEEFRSIYLGYKPSENPIKGAFFHDDEEHVESVNWVTKGKVGPVKDQGQCGSCWAFSTVGSSEPLKAITTGTIGDFSEQEFVSCCSLSHLTCTCQGCNGGSMDQGLGYAAAHGYCTESSYPYTAKSDFSSCAVNSCTKDSFTISSHTDVKQSSSALKSACNKQPVSIAVDAQNWSPYSSGIFSNCGTQLDHGVVLVGYTTSYWLVRNSWSASWGENGYIRLHSGNTCGLEDSAVYPNV